MIQNSLDRLFEGLAASLRDTVAPEVDDPYAKSQVLAAVELLNNLATRVQWRQDQIGADVSAVRAALVAAEAPIPEDEHDRAAHLRALADVPTDARRAIVREQLERELALLRTGMYR